MKRSAWTLVVVLCAACSQACFAEAPLLPAPPGPYGIGRFGYYWTDHARTERLPSDKGDGAGGKRDREMMVYFWYPTELPASEPHGEYRPGAGLINADQELGRVMREGYGEVWPEILSGAVYSHAVEDAALAKSPARFPLVIFSHGQGGSAFGYTALLEAMVSRGYVIVTIEHPGTADVVVFPDGRLVRPHEEPAPAGLTQAEKMQRMMEEAGKGIEVGAADERFVLDRLTAINKKGTTEERGFRLAGRLDLNRVAVMGHSAGADFAARACELDARWKACVDLDGAMAPVEALPEFPDGKKVLHPLLFLEAYHDEAHIFGTHEEKQAFFKKEKEQLAECPKGSYDVVLRPPGMVHGSFSDWYVLSAKTPELRAQAVHNLGLVERYVLAFLDGKLKGVAAPLLEDEQAPHPDAMVERLGK